MNKYGDLRYISFNSYLKNKYKCKVYRIPVIADFTCPNRDGSKGENGCVYCNSLGSGVTFYKKDMSIQDQILFSIERLKKSRKAKKFFIYFQAFSNTYADIDHLENIYSEALSVSSDIVGLIIGTRPDCINKKILGLIKKYTSKFEVWIEYGLQSIHEKSLEWMNRRHTLQDFEKAVNLTNQINSQLQNKIKVTVHVIFGLPLETKREMLDTIKYLSNKDLDGIKFHSLYIEKDTRLEQIYLKKTFDMLTVEEYTDLIVESLELLNPKIIIHRLTGDIRDDLLVAPYWIANKNIVLNLINKKLYDKKTFQGNKFNDSSSNYK